MHGSSYSAMSRPVVWRFAEPPPDGFRLDLAAVGGPSGTLPARLLFNRGITNDRQAREFLNPDIRGLTTPFDLPDMDTASSRLLAAIVSEEPIGVLGDFDVDGLTGTAILVDAITRLGGRALPYIPHREKEGHGLSNQAVSYFKDAGVNLVVTVDTGIDALDEVDAAAQSGIDTIITDHHVAPGTLPAAVAIVNPGLSDTTATGLTGAGVAFMLSRAMFELDGTEQPEFHIALAALGTIADRGPLRGDNRRIAKAGLVELSRTDHAGLQALMQVSGPDSRWKNPTADSVAFQLAPRLNAPGRLDDATPSLELLITNDFDRAQELSGFLDSCNRERRRSGRRVTPKGPRPDRRPNRAEGNRCRHIRCRGGRSARAFGGKTVRADWVNRRFAVSVAEGVARGSARSVPGFDIHSALKPSDPLLTRFGGHARAAGFTTPASSLDEVLDAVNKQAEWKLMGVEPHRELISRLRNELCGTPWLNLGLNAPVESIRRRKPGAGHRLQEPLRLQRADCGRRRRPSAG